MVVLLLQHTDSASFITANMTVTRCAVQRSAYDSYPDLKRCAVVRWVLQALLRMRCCAGCALLS